MTWDEARHPRVPSGSSHGGEFAPRGGEIVFGISMMAERGQRLQRPLRDAEVREFTRKNFGKELGQLEVAQLAGAFPGTEVTIKTAEIDDRLSVEMSLPDPDDPEGPPIMTAQRVLSGTNIWNENLDVSPRWQGRGIGLEVFGTQVDSAVKHGYWQMETLAVGSAKKPGYSSQIGWWAWARMGYDGDVPDEVNGGRGPRGERTIHELMMTPEGTSWWKANGESFVGVFDLRSGSTSRRVFDEYRRLKRG